MAIDLDVTSSAWGTAALQKSTGELYDQAAQNQVADNGGYNFYRPAFVSLIESNLVATGGAEETRTTYVYMNAGTYQAYAKASFTLETTGARCGSVSLDGTNILVETTSGNNTSTDNAEVIASSDGWYDAVYTATSDADSDATISEGAIYIRQKA